MTDFDFIATVPVEGTVPATVTDPTERDKRKASLKLVYEQEIKRYVDRTIEYEANKIKAYSFLHDQCNKAMLAKIKQCTNFATTILNNPIELLKAIKEISLNYKENKHPMRSIIEALRHLLGLKQKQMKT